MAHYLSCKNCGNGEDGDDIYKCESCGRIFCDSCIGHLEGDFLKLDTWCPHCEHRWKKRLGSIDNAADDDDDDDPVDDDYGDDDNYDSISSISNSSSYSSTNNSDYSFIVVLGIAIGAVLGIVTCYNNWQDRALRYNDKVGEGIGSIVALPIFVIIFALGGAVVGLVIMAIIHIIAGKE